MMMVILLMMRRMNHFDGVDEAGDSCAVQYENSSNTVQGRANIGSPDMSVRSSLGARRGA